MTIIKIGCCGFPIAKEKYYKEFDLVEINSTFYKIPSIKLAQKWRNEAPENFEYALKAYQGITHDYKMEIKKECLDYLNQMIELCKNLKSKILLFQTPASFTPEYLNKAEKFFSKIKYSELKIVWETRGEKWLEIYDKLSKILEKYSITHVVDPFINKPCYINEIAYYRLHGLSKKMYYYKFSDNDLLSLKEKIFNYSKKANEIYVLFNNINMYEDSIRFKKLLEKNTLPKTLWGIDAIIEKLSSIKFPISKKEIIEKYGKKKVFVTSSLYMSIFDIFKKVSDKKYKSLKEIKDELESIISEKVS
ncbi:MAG: DUF72 domain-containing protein [Nitrososphaerota archaeon]